MDSCDFSVSDHATYLAGYMDAVGRVLSTNEELVALSSFFAADLNAVERLMGPVTVQEPITRSWSAEFGAVIRDGIGLDERSRLGFYLIDYIDWFRQFTNGAQCCPMARHEKDPRATYEAVYQLSWDGGSRVIISFSRARKEAA